VIGCVVACARERLWAWRYPALTGELDQVSSTEGDRQYGCPNMLAAGIGDDWRGTACRWRSAAIDHVIGKELFRGQRNLPVLAQAGEGGWFPDSLDLFTGLAAD
jgi:hypothetical protein